MTLNPDTTNGVEVYQHPAYPWVWVVEEYKRILWFKKRAATHWFLEKDQAFEFAEELRKKPKR